MVGGGLGGGGCWLCSGGGRYGGWSVVVGLGSVGWCVSGQWLGRVGGWCWLVVGGGWQPGRR